MNDTNTTGSSAWRRPPWPVLLIFGLALLLALIVALLPYAVQWYLGDWLRDRGLAEVSIEDIDINPFAAVFDIESLEYVDDSGRHRAGHARANLSWTDLMEGRIRLTSVELQDSTLVIRRTESNRWLLGTIVLGAQEAVAEAEQSESEAGLGFGIDELRISNVTVDYRDPLISRQFTIESLQLADFATWAPEQATRLDVMLTSGSASLTVAGDAKPFADAASLELDVNAEDLDAAGLDALLQQIGIDSISGVMQADLEVRVRLPAADAATSVVVDGSAALENWRLTRAGESVDLDRLGWDGELNLSLADGGNRIRAVGELELGQLALQAAPLSLLIQAAGWNGTTTVLTAEPGLSVEFDGQLSTTGMAYTDGVSQLTAELDELGSRIEGVTSEAQHWRLDTDGTLETTGIAVSTPAIPSLLRLGGLSASLIRPQPDALLALDSLSLNQLSLIERGDPAADDASHLLELTALNIDGLSFSSSSLVVGATLLDGLRIWLERRQDGSLELDDLLADGTDEAEQAGATAAGEPDTAVVTSDAAPFSFSLAGVQTAGDSGLVYVDRSVKPMVKLEFAPLAVELGELDAAQPDADTPLRVEAAQGRYGSVKFSGQLRPLAEETFVQGEGSIRDLNMIALNGFARRALGYRISAGTLSADIDVDLEGQSLDSEADLTIRRLTIKPLRADEQDEFSAQLGVPLGTALGLLEDDEETIRLNIPLQGELSQLSVGIGDAIRLVVQKGLMAGLQTAATTYFAPLWPALAANKLFAVATQLKFEDLQFAPAVSELDSDQVGYLDNMAVLLAKRAKVSLSLCGRAVAADAAVLFPDAAGELTADQSEALAELAQQRHEAVKDQLIAAGIESDRLVTCTPAARPADQGAPRVDFST